MVKLETEQKIREIISVYEGIPLESIGPINININFPIILDKKPIGVQVCLIYELIKSQINFLSTKYPGMLKSGEIKAALEKLRREL